ncbi:MAG: methyltransferase domain-containing protein [Candidatus Scalindua sp.]
MNAKMTLDQLFDMINVEYKAPADASNIDLPSKSIDFHVSNTVFEHIQPDVLGNILLEGKRLLKDNGLFIHFIDHSDHFSHSDTSISAINFLKYNESKWNRYAGNRYAYHNRLRIDDFLHLINKVGFTILSTNTKIDERSLEALRKGYSLDERFINRDEKTNATISTKIVAALNQHG